MESQSAPLVWSNLDPGTHYNETEQTKKKSLITDFSWHLYIPSISSQLKQSCKMTKNKILFKPNQDNQTVTPEKQ